MALPGTTRYRSRATEHRVDQHRWLVSYADFITLLFAFFATLYAISNVDLQKMSRLVSSLQVAFDIRGVSGTPRRTGQTLDPAAVPLRPGATAPPALPTPQDLPKLPVTTLAALDRGLLQAALGGVQHRLAAGLAPAIRDGRVSLEIDRRGLVVSIRETGAFAIGSAEIPEATRALIGEIGAALKTVPNMVRVEGHTDNVPIHTPRFASNWELSTARATAVVAFFVQELAVSPDRFSAAGYAEFHPRVANDTAGNRARNRRVDIVILNQTTSEAEEPGLAGRNR